MINKIDRLGLGWGGVPAQNFAVEILDQKDQRPYIPDLELDLFIKMDD